MRHDPPQLKRPCRDPILCAIGDGDDPSAKRIDTGVYQTSHFSGDMLLCGGNLAWENSYFSIGEFESYGVVDSPSQFIEKLGPLMDRSADNMVAFLTHIRKDPSNKGRGGGWRWHKWGPYIGNGQPTCEYLDDEDGFEEGVWTYHIYKV